MSSFFPRFESPEGVTPITDYSGLKPKWMHTMRDLNRVEAENIMKAQQKWLQHPVSSPDNFITLSVTGTKRRCLHSWHGTFGFSHTCQAHSLSQTGE